MSRWSDPEYVDMRTSPWDRDNHEPEEPEFCQWFVKCINQAVGVVPHPILGDVPICKRCADKLELDIEQR